MSKSENYDKRTQQDWEKTDTAISHGRNRENTRYIFSAIITVKKSFCSK